MDPFPIKQNDRLPSLEATLSAEGSELPDLDGVVVYFVMKNPKTGLVKLRKLATVVDAAEKTVRYDWEAGDTDTSGTFYGEFEVQFDGKPWTFPNPGYIPITIAPDLG